MKRVSGANGGKPLARRRLAGRYIVTDPAICHGKPTFRGTRIMVSQVLAMVADGMGWEAIVEQCHDSISREAIAEAITLASRVFVERAHEYSLEPARA